MGTMHLTGSDLKKIRDQLGITRAEFANHLGLSASGIQTADEAPSTTTPLKLVSN